MKKCRAYDSEMDLFFLGLRPKPLQIINQSNKLIPEAANRQPKNLIGADPVDVLKPTI